MRPALRTTFHVLQFVFGLLLLTSLVASVFSSVTPAGRFLAGLLAAGLAYQLVRVARLRLRQRSGSASEAPSPSR